MPVRGPGSALECGGHSALFLSALVPRGLPHRHPPRRRNVPRSHCTHSAAASPNLTRCLPHPRTLTPLWSRSRFQTASWQRLGQHGRQHVLHVLLHGPVGVWRGLLGALRSPLALLALKRTDLAHCPHSPSHPDSLSDPLSHVAPNSLWYSAPPRSAGYHGRNLEFRRCVVLGREGGGCGDGRRFLLPCCRRVRHIHDHVWLEDREGEQQSARKGPD